MPHAGTVSRSKRSIPGFTPMQRVEEQEIEEEEDEGGEVYSLAQEENIGPQGEHLTKTGKVDRRYKGFRDLPAEEEANPNYRRAQMGPVIEGMHLTLDQRPDRRFKENRGLSDDESMKVWSERLYDHYHSGSHRSH